MLSKTSIVLNTLHSAQEFMDTNASALGTLNTSQSRRDLDDVEAALSDHAATQARSKTSAKSFVTRKRVVKNTLLVKYLRPISAIAAAKLSQSPDAGTMTVPKNLRTTPQVLAAAEAVGGAAAKHADVFIAAGMAPTFVADMQAAADEVKAAEAAQASTVSSRLGATKALVSTAKQAHKVVKQLDALIVPQLANNTALLVKWKATKRFSGRITRVSIAASDSAHQPAVSSPADPAPVATSTPPSAGGAPAA